MAEIGYLLGFVDLGMTFWPVAAAGALTPLVAESTFGEALTVHL